jgi:SAM-dependent methyltransferase
LAYALSYIQFRIDTTKYLLDKPKLDYQPLPWVGITSAGIRGDSSYARWTNIRENLSGEVEEGTKKTALDIGSCYGFFSLNLAEEGYSVIGIDLNPRHTRIANFATPEKLADICSFVRFHLAPDNISITPKTDVTLLLSVWHHWVQSFGFENATEMLKEVWRSSGQSLFFETGEADVKDEFNLPFGAENPREWIQNYLLETCEDSDVTEIGEHAAPAYQIHDQIPPKRGLFLVNRISPSSINGN